jgi:hypothetical protein
MVVARQQNLHANGTNGSSPPLSARQGKNATAPASGLLQIMEKGKKTLSKRYLFPLVAQA